MAPTEATARHSAAILNACWMVRHYRRPGQERHRERAIRALGAAVREAFDRSEDFEPLLAAIVQGLSQDDTKRPF